MSVLAGFSCSDRWKPDSTATNANGDKMTFHTYSTIDTAAGLVWGSECLSLQMDVLKGSCQANIGLPSTPSSEWAIGMFVKFTNDGSFAAPTVASRYLGTDTAAGTRLEWKYVKNGVSTTTYLLRFFWDGTQIGADQTITIGTIYRIATYVKLGTLSVADSTFKVYIDDMTSGMTDTFSATNVISTTTATFTNTPAYASTVLDLGTTSGGSSFGNVIIKMAHGWFIDTTTGGTFTDPVNRVLQPIVWSKKSVPVTVDASYNDFTTTVGTGDLADNTSGPDDATSYIGCTIATGNPDKFSLWTVTPWATVGYSTGDEIGVVRTSNRIATNLGTNGSATGHCVHREGGTNVYSNGLIGIWTGKIAGASSGVAFQNTPAGSGGNWSPTLYDAHEIGARCQFGGFGGTDTKMGLTWARADALFRMKAAVVSGQSAPGGTLQGMSVGIY